LTIVAQIGFNVKRDRKKTKNTVGAKHSARSSACAFWLFEKFFGKLIVQRIEDLSDTDNFLKVPRSGTFKKLSGFYGSARRCIISL